MNKNMLPTNHLREKLLGHRGHEIQIASYGDPANPENVSLECAYCNAVIIDTDIYDLCAARESRTDYEIKFKNASQMLAAIEQYDLWSPSSDKYVCEYNEAGAIAVFPVDERDAAYLIKKARESGETCWAALLGPNGKIWDDPNDKNNPPNPGCSNIDFCERYFGETWILVENTADYLALPEIYYFTYGSDGIFKGGWSEIEAPDRKTATRLHKLIHGLSAEGLGRYAACYSRHEFMKTAMFEKDKNLDNACVERISFKIERIKELQS